MFSNPGLAGAQAPAQATAPQATCSQLFCGDIGLNFTPYIVGAAVGIGVGGALIGWAVYASHHHLEGCVAAKDDHLEITESAKSRPWDLSGATTGIQAGHRVRLHGTRRKHAGAHSFEVQKLARDLGPCS